ncbi:glycosyl hydrolase family 61-domain-containing protein [Coemansia spiralis]|nr:glycosyl hydrolase family 61-domain-containing protein [Coemansia spiralis]
MYLLFLLLVRVAHAHTYLFSIDSGGETHKENQCIRPYITEATRNFPVTSVTSADLTCRTSNMNQSATEMCSAVAGSVVTLHWHNRNDSPEDKIIAKSHTGPCIVYMAPMSSNGAGDVWFKVYESGWNNITKQWCTDKLIDKRGLLDIIIPSNIKAGDYLLRGEIIALHGASRLSGTQFFPNCVQLTITGGGSSEPTGVALPGYYKATDPGILYRRSQTDNSKYIIPGPPIYNSSSESKVEPSESESPVDTGTTVVTSSSSASVGSVPTQAASISKQHKCSRRRSGSHHQFYKYVLPRKHYYYYVDSLQNRRNSKQAYLNM